MPLASLQQTGVIRSILDELESSILQHNPISSPCLSRGKGGIALFLAYLSRLPGKESCRESAYDLLAEAVDGAGLVASPRFYAGYAGIGWAVEHLQREILVDEDGPSEDGNEAVDEVLLDVLAADGWTGDYDLISGLVGLGVYALERVDRPSARRILARLLDHLEALACPQSEGIGWMTPSHHLPIWQLREAPDGYLNLGLAHGIPGVILLLAALTKVGERHPEIDRRRARTLLEAGMACLLSRFQPRAIGSYLAAWHPLNRQVPPPSRTRLAWCYGDLGASLAIFQVGKLIGREDWSERAIEMARLAAERPLKESGIRDVSLCHGSAGNMLVFQRMAHLTGSSIFRDSAALYLEHLIASHQAGAPLAGYTVFKPDLDEKGDLRPGSEPFKPDPGLLEGAAGAGLALLSALGLEPKWDRFMMLSLPDLT